MTEPINFFWEEYPTPIKYTDAISGKEIVKTGEYKCTHPLVDKAWATGSLSGEKGNDIAIIHSHLLMKDGTRHDFDDETFDFSKINTFLKDKVD